MFVKTQFNGVLVNLDSVESIKTERPTEHTVIIEAETPQGTRYNLATTATRKEADEIINTITKSLAEGAPIFDLEEYAAARMEREAGKRAAETRRKYQREHWAETQGRKVEKSDNGAALDWNNYIETDTNQPRGFSRAEVMGVNNMDPEEFERRRGEIVERIAAGTDIIKCDYPTDARGVILQQSGDAIDRPATWQKIYMENIEAGGGVNINLESYNEATGIKSCDCLGRYATMEAPRIFRELREKVESGAALIEMP